MEANEIMRIAVEAADDKRGENILVLDMKGLSVIADYFLICHGNSEKQVEAIAREIKDQMQERDFEVKRVEGLESSRWVLMDLNSVIVHIFHKDERQYYNLEKLWGDAPVLTGEQVLNSNK